MSFNRSVAKLPELRFRVVSFSARLLTVVVRTDTLKVAVVVVIAGFYVVNLLGEVDTTGNRAERIPSEDPRSTNREPIGR